MANLRCLTRTLPRSVQLVGLGVICVAAITAVPVTIASSATLMSSQPITHGWGPVAPGTTAPVAPDYAHHVAGSGGLTPHVAGSQNEDDFTTNWSGLLDTGSTYGLAEGTWIVPAVSSSPSTGVSSTWVGIDGSGSSDPTIIQTGTAQNITSGTTQYFAWYEIYPAPSVVIGGVNPGDEISAQVSEVSAGTWTITLDDLTLDATFSENFSYSGPASSAEWIEEQQQVLPGPEPPLADFGSVSFSQMEISVASPSDVVSNPVFMTSATTGLVTAYPSSIGSTTMSIDYGQVPSQTSISASPSSVSQGGAVTYSASVTGMIGTPNLGTVDFSVGGTQLCAVTLSDGSASCSSSGAPVGNDTISGTYFGNPVFSGSSGTTKLTVNASAPPPPPPPPVSPPTSHGYWLVGSDGGIFSFGSAQFYGSMGGIALQRPVVGIVATRDRGGYWLDASDGGVFSFGDTQFYGSIPGLGIHPYGSGLPNSLDAPIVGMVPSADDGGYFMVGADGGVFAFGDAKFAGSCPGIGGCSGAAVAVMPDASGNGYWVVTATGHVYAFGDAPNLGEPGPQGGVPVTSAVRSPNGTGYMILFGNGAIASYGSTPYVGCPLPGSYGGLNPATAIFTTSDGSGYWVASADGSVMGCGEPPDGPAPNYGSMAGKNLNGSIIAASGS